MQHVAHRASDEIADLKSANALLHSLITNRDAEIERLTREQAKAAAEYQTSCKALYGEIGRLRTAARLVVETWDAEDHPVPMPNLRQSIEALERALGQAAREEDGK